MIRMSNEFYFINEYKHLITNGDGQSNKHVQLWQGRQSHALRPRSDVRMRKQTEKRPRHRLPFIARAARLTTKLYALHHG